MRILVLGANGMLGHKIAQLLSEDFSVVGSVRGTIEQYSEEEIFRDIPLIGNVKADDFSTVEDAIKATSPDYVINCIGIVKQLPSAQDSIASILINALFPHQLAQYCKNLGIKVIHYSTDCVFSGEKGMYQEGDFPDANDLYGRTKYLGEISYDNSLTLRTSLIGRELNSTKGLIEWFISQNGKTVNGYTQAIFSGLTTKAHADILKQIITKCPDLHGVWHLSSEPISKHSLLKLVKEIYQLNIQIIPDESVVCNRSLDSRRFQEITGIIPPGWDQMISEMFIDDKSRQV